MEEPLTSTPLLPPQKPNYWLWIVVCIVMLALGIGIGLFLAKNVYPPLQIIATPTPSPIAVVDPTANWKIYTNNQLGFELKYPSTFSIHLGKDIEKIPSYIPVCSNSALVCLYYPEDVFPKTDFTGAGISVNILKEKNTETTCKMIDAPGFSLLSQTLINGIIFTTWPLNGAAAGHQNTDQIYHAFRANSCFEIVTRVTTESRSVNSPTGIYAEFTPGDKNEVFTLLERILSTFKFVGQRLTKEAAIELVKGRFPEVKMIEENPNITIGKSMGIYGKQENGVWKILFWQGSGDCPSGCLNDHEWYFIVKNDGSVEKAGEFERNYNPKKNGYDEKGAVVPGFRNE